MAYIGQLKKNVLLRRPCLMEDEGIYHPMMQFDSFDEVNKWLEGADCVTGYFSASDFVYTGPGGPGQNKYNLKRFGVTE